MFDFEDLLVYNKAVELHISIDEMLNSIKTHRYVRDQLGRASLSVALNIAEGASRFSKKDRRRFYVISRGSAYECAALSGIMNKNGLLTTEVATKLRSKYLEISKMLYAMIKRLEE